MRLTLEPPDEFAHPTRYCIDILAQLAAVNTALEAVGLEVLGEHVRHCVTGGWFPVICRKLRSRPNELLEAVQRFAKMR